MARIRTMSVSARVSAWLLGSYVGRKLHIAALNARLLRLEPIAYELALDIIKEYKCFEGIDSLNDRTAISSMEKKAEFQCGHESWDCFIPRRMRAKFLSLTKQAIVGAVIGTILLEVKLNRGDVMRMLAEEEPDI